jgi:hypothetical protein
MLNVVMPSAVVPNIVRLAGPIVIKLFTAVIYEWANKLGCLSLASFPAQSNFCE